MDSRTKCLKNESINNNTRATAYRGTKSLDSEEILSAQQLEQGKRADIIEPRDRGSRILLHNASSDGSAAATSPPRRENAAFTKRDNKRKKKPSERKVLAKDIPGHMGDRDLEITLHHIEPEKYGPTSSANNSRSANNNHNSNNNKHNNNKKSSNTSNNHYATQQTSIGNSNNNIKTKNTSWADLVKKNQVDENTPTNATTTTTTNNTTTTNGQKVNGKRNNAGPNNSAVTFAHNPPVAQDKITFGFFEDISQATPGATHANRPKQNSKPSLKSENTINIKLSHEDTMDAKSFNYDHVLSYVNKCWENCVITYKKSNSTRVDNQTAS